MRIAAPPFPTPAGDTDEAPDSLFEHFGWFYGFLRERVFQDDTERIAAAFWPRGGDPAARGSLLEVGCGPGFYSRRLAARFPRLRVVGVDRSTGQLELARRRAARRGLHNCCFQRADVRALPWPAGAVDAVISSRLFTVLAEREAALAEMFRVLRPGGRCFLAEPRSSRRAGLVLSAMWALAHLAPPRSGGGPRAYREPARPVILSANQFASLIASQPWANVWRWEEGNYQYALAQKGREHPLALTPGGPAPP